MRTLIRDLNRAGATIDRPVWDIDAEGYGRAVYRVRAFGDTASLVAFSTPLAEEDRTDRVIAEAWDTSYVLYDGVPGPPNSTALKPMRPARKPAASPNATLS